MFNFFVYFLFNSEKKQSHNKECVDGEEMKPLNELKKGLNFFYFLGGADNHMYLMARRPP